MPDRSLLPLPEHPSSAPAYCRCDVVPAGLEPSRCRCSTETCPTACVETLHPGREHDEFVAEADELARRADKLAGVPSGYALEARRRAAAAGHPVAGTFGLAEGDRLERELRTYLSADDARDARRRFNEAAKDDRALPSAAVVNIEALPSTAPTGQRCPRPTLGRIVHVLVHPSLNGGQEAAAAFVTRVHGYHADGTWLVNLRVILDGTNHTHEWATSRRLHATEDLARAAHASQLERLRDLDPDHAPFGVYGHAYWPARA